MFDKIKRYFYLGIYKEKHLKNFVLKGIITPEQYEQITGEDYVA